MAMDLDNWCPVTLEYLAHSGTSLEARHGGRHYRLPFECILPIMEAVAATRPARDAKLKAFLDDLEPGTAFIVRVAREKLEALGIPFNRFFYVTFGPGQVHSIEGMALDQETLGVLVATGLDNARKKARRFFGSRYFGVQEERPEGVVYRKGEIHLPA